MTEPALLALTQGDPSGIGPDITLLVWLQRRPEQPFAVVGDPALYRRRAHHLGLDVPIEEVDFARAAAVFAKALPVVATGHAVEGAPGTPVVSDAFGTIAAIDQAVAALRGGLASAVVTNPIAKHVLYEAGFAHPGHTEYLGVLAAKHWGGSPTPVMMLWSEDLAVVPVTIHVALSAVPGMLTGDLISSTAVVVRDALRDRFGIAEPRLACAGLNPHAGEDGSMGREEIDIIGPALERLRSGGMAIEGPLSADTLFHPAARKRYDAVLTMYHDQGLIPIKTLSFDTGVNLTLGLPFTRTSPDHGTAFGIAGQGSADPASLMAALTLARRLCDVCPTHRPA